jgi:hypothetical protein
MNFHSNGEKTKSIKKIKVTLKYKKSKKKLIIYCNGKKNTVIEKYELPKDYLNVVKLKGANETFKIYK